MTPHTEHEKSIVSAVDRKAVAIRVGQGEWGDNIITEMKVVFPFDLTKAEEEFLLAYVYWRRENPIST